MSEFEGYQETATPSDVQYESMAAQDQQPGAVPSTAAYPVADYESQQPVEGADSPVNEAAKKAGESVNKIMEKLGKMGVLLALWAASLIYTIAAGVVCFPGVCLDTNGYAFAVGMISLIISLVYIILIRFTQVLTNNDTVHHVMGWFFAVWWLAGTITGTFASPFVTTGNGFFAAWGALLLSLMYLMMVSPLVKQNAEKMQAAVANESMADLGGLAFASLVELIAASALCTPCIDGYYGFAVSLGVISLVVVAICIFLTRSQNANTSYSTIFSVLTIFLAIWWVLGFCIVTFGAPFITTGNGYFATFFAAILSVRLIRNSAFFKSMVEKFNLAAGTGSVSSSTAATYAEEPQYVSNDAYAPQSTEGMDF